jgi:hypothetical protein
VEAGLKPASLSLHFDQDEQSRGIVGMEIKEGLKERFHSIENNPQKRLDLLAFCDFCFDLFEEEYGRMFPEEEIDPRFVKGLLIQT